MLFREGKMSNLGNSRSQLGAYMHMCMHVHVHA